MDLPQFPIIEGEVVHITSLETHPLLNELIYLDTIPSYSDERLYDIRAKICNLDGNFDLYPCTKKTYSKCTSFFISGVLGELKFCKTSCIKYLVN